MNEIKRSVEYSIERGKALRNCESHIANVLWKAAQQIVSKSSKYRKAGKLVNERALLSDAMKITEKTEEDIEKYISAYSKTSCKILGIEDKDIDTFLKSEIFGKTASQRNATYLANFAEDIVRMIKAGTMMRYSDSQLLSAIRTGYKDPYKASVITKARKKDVNIATPSYGKGIYRNAYSNIIRNARQVVSISWGMAEQKYGEENNAIGFEVYRGSSYPCDLCDSMVGFHEIGEQFPPFHPHCVCGCRFVYKGD